MISIMSCFRAQRAWVKGEPAIGEDTVRDGQARQRLVRQDSVAEIATIPSPHFLPPDEAVIATRSSGAGGRLMLTSQQPAPAGTIDSPSSAQVLRANAMMQSMGEIQMMTVVSSDCKLIIHQNDLSLKHIGCAFNGSEIITRIFSLAPPDAYRSMMDAIEAGRSWKQVIQVPPSLKLSNDLNQEECRFGSFALPYGAHAFLPGVLQLQTQEELDAKALVQLLATAVTITPPSVEAVIGSLAPALAVRLGGPDATHVTDTFSSSETPKSNLTSLTPTRTLSLLKFTIASRSASGDAPIVQPKVKAYKRASTIDNTILVRSFDGLPSQQPGVGRSGFKSLCQPLQMESKEDTEMLSALMGSEVIPGPSPVLKRDHDGKPFPPIDEDVELSREDMDGEEEMTFMDNVQHSLKSSKGEAAPIDAVAHVECLEIPPETACCFHEVKASSFFDPITSQRAILLVQTDVTSRVVVEDLLMGMSEGQLEMLSSIFPRHVLEFMSFTEERRRLETIGGLARKHPMATILFMDIVGFTSMAKQVEPQVVMTFLNQLFTVFDSLCDIIGAQKVETAGDCYIAAAGILDYDDEGFWVVNNEGGDQPSTLRDPAISARCIMSLAKAMMAGSKTVMMPHNGEPVSIRIGMHTGPCVSGLIGTKLPKFSIFGDTMNTASRMESTSHPGLIQVSKATWHLLKDSESFRPTGGIEIKGKGLMPTFIWEEAKAEERVLDLKPRENSLDLSLNLDPSSPISRGSPITAALQHDQSSSLVVAHALVAALAATGIEPVLDRRRDRLAKQRSTSFTTNTMTNTAGRPGGRPGPRASLKFLVQALTNDDNAHSQPMPMAINRGRSVASSSRSSLLPGLSNDGRMELKVNPGLVAMCQSSISIQKLLHGQGDRPNLRKEGPRGALPAGAARQSSTPQQPF